jgi:hypothetical protein
MWFSTASIITACCASARHLHAARVADAGMRNVAVAADLVRRVDDHHPALQVVGEHARRLAQQRRLADARAADAAARSCPTRSRRGRRRSSRTRRGRRGT